ncbi:hypothetical protein J3E69DRAFT_330216 [Trichoderma sp. SZMC 28015]
MVASRRERRGWNCGYEGRSYDEATSSKRILCTCVHWERCSTLEKLAHEDKTVEFRDSVC